MPSLSGPDRQQETFDARVAELRDQKIRSRECPTLIPSGMRTPYRGAGGHETAHSEAKAKIQMQNAEYLNKVANDHNVQIDKRLDAQQKDPLRPESGPRTEPLRRVDLPAELRRARKTTGRTAREKEQDQTQQQQRQRGLQR